jgi:hypothetical protein
MQVGTYGRIALSEAFTATEDVDRHSLSLAPTEHLFVSVFFARVNEVRPCNKLSTIEMTFHTTNKLTPHPSPGLLAVACRTRGRYAIGTCCIQVAAVHAASLP